MSLKKSWTWFDRLTTNGDLGEKSISNPFVLSASKDPDRVFGRSERQAVSAHRGVYTYQKCGEKARGRAENNEAPTAIPSRHRCRW